MAFENEIAIIADKLGMSVQAMYDINLGVQHAYAICNGVVILFAIVVILSFITLNFYYCGYSNDLDAWCGVFFASVCACIILIIGAVTIENFVVIPWMCPEYTAMTATIHQIECMMP